jgi:hypothetical protein
VKTHPLLWMFLGILLVGTLPAAAQHPPALPISTAWMYLADDQAYNQIPAEWSAIDFSVVDVLTVGPAGIQDDKGTFGLYNSPQTGDLAHRFKWVLQTARKQNPNIRIIVSQWWGDGTGKWGDSLSSLRPADLRKYADSVRAFLAAYLNTSGGVDGYDIDYEANNVLCSTAELTRTIRTELDHLSTATGGRRFYLTVSPARTTYLKDAVPSLDFVNMQTYAGGKGLTPKMFTDMGLKPRQLLYGICPESDCDSPTLDEVKKAYTANKLAGIHLWRLNSDNYQHEGEVQRQVYKFLHGATAGSAPPKAAD